MLSTDRPTKFFGPEIVERSVYLYVHFSQCGLFRCSFACHSKGLPLNHKDVGMSCNEDPDV